MKQLVVASTFYQCVSLAAAVDAEALPPVDGERILLLATSAQVPELALPLDQQLGFATVAARFDRVIDLAALIYPRRPVQFAPRRDELAMWQTLLRQAWGLGDEPVQLLMDSVQVNPALALAAIFREAELWAHSDGLMCYSPTRTALPLDLSQRIRGLVHVDLVPGLRPQLLAEHDPEHRVVPRAALETLLRQIAGGVGDATGPAGDTALILGQYLTSLGLLTPEQETALHDAMIETAAARGVRRCVFRPHPSAPPSSTWDLQETARRLHLTLEVDDRPMIAELLMISIRPAIVISCFSTGLATAHHVLGLPAVAVGTPTLLTQLEPYANSNRIPLVLADALFAEGFEAPAEESGRGPARSLAALVQAVGHVMQPLHRPDGREPAEHYLQTVLADEPELHSRYFDPRRLGALGLPGGIMAATGPAPRTARLRRLHRGARRRIGGAAQVLLGRPG